MTNPFARRVYDRQPPMAQGQLWKGGAADLTARRMVADPPRWVHLADAALPPPELAPLLAWDMKQIEPGALNSPDLGREDEFNVWCNINYIAFLNLLLGVIAARRFQRDRAYFMCNQRIA